MVTEVTDANVKEIVERMAKEIVDLNGVITKLQKRKVDSVRRKSVVRLRTV